MQEVGGPSTRGLVGSIAVIRDRLLSTQSCRWRRPANCHMRPVRSSVLRRRMRCWGNALSHTTNQFSKACTIAGITLMAHVRFEQLYFHAAGLTGMCPISERGFLRAITIFRG